MNRNRGALLDILSCPGCLGDLKAEDSCLVCRACDLQYVLSVEGTPDMRLVEPRVQSVEFTVGQGIDEAIKFPCRPLEAASRPAIDVSRMDVPSHFTSELISWIPRSTHEAALALDLGCGTEVHRPLVEHAGFRYVGLDYGGDNPSVLGDAHALPFRDELFDFVLTIAVFEHLQYPAVAAQEMARVLRPGGLVLGTVAFLEPFHGNSFYHHSHLAVHSTLSSAGLEPIAIAPNTEWHALTALSKMGGVPAKSRPILQLARTIESVRQTLRPMPARIVASTGSFFFIARKPSGEPAARIAESR